MDSLNANKCGHKKYILDGADWCQAFSLARGTAQTRDGTGRERASLYTRAHVPPSRSKLGLRSLQTRTRPKRTLSCLPIFHQHSSQPQANRSPALHRAMTSTPSTMYSTPATAPAATSAGPGGNLVSHILNSFIFASLSSAPHPIARTRVIRSEALHPRATRHAKQSEGDEAIKKKKRGAGCRLPVLIISATFDWLEHVSMAMARVGSPASGRKKLGCWPVGGFCLFPPKTSPVLKSLLSLAPEILSTSPFPFSLPVSHDRPDTLRYHSVPSRSGFLSSSALLQSSQP